MNAKYDTEKEVSIEVGASLALPDAFNGGLLEGS